MSPPIRGFVENTLLDWEGKLASIIFLPGCNYRCRFCHAQHLIDPPDHVESIPTDSVLRALRRQRGWIDGVVLSGGEPTLHPDLLELIEAVREQGLLVKLDTNGSKPDVLEKLLLMGVIDYVAMDIKAPLDEKYSLIARVPVKLEAIRRSIELLISGTVEYEFRTTVYPADLDDADIERIALDIRGARLFYLQSFRPANTLDPDLAEVKPYTMMEMREFCRIASKYVRRCAVRGDQASEIMTAAAS
jgi:pyruvate formate lyase activating enzyme